MFSVADSQGKEPPGTMSGALSWTGSYEQCLDVKATGEPTLTHWPTMNATVELHDFDAQYCMIYYNITV